MITNKIRYEDYNQACIEYSKSETLQRAQRFGQFLVNRLDLRTDDPEDTQALFFEKRAAKARSIFLEKFGSHLV